MILKNCFYFSENKLIDYVIYTPVYKIAETEGGINYVTLICVCNFALAFV